jgi:pimeloyl-ACP methyl ester carboxylesterase
MCNILTIVVGNYYRTRLANFKVDRPLLDVEHGVRIKCPTLFVRALKDDMITSEIVDMMGVNVPHLAMRKVDAGHWLLWEKPRDVNAFITDWMEQQGLISTVAA